MAQDLARDHLTHDGRHEARGAQVGALGARGTRGGGDANGLFAGVEDAQVADAALAAFLAHDARKGAVDRLVHVGDAQALGVDLLGAAHGADELEAALLGQGGEGELGGNGIDGIDHVVDVATRLLEAGLVQFYEVLGEHEGVVCEDAAARIDIGDHGGHDVDLAFAHGALECDGLAIDVGGGDHVLVHDGERPDAAARERLDAARAHATATEYEHTGVFETGEPFVAEHDAQAVLHRFHGCSS